MKKHIADISLRKIARIAGFVIIILIIVGSYVFFTLNTGLEPPGNAAIAAANNIKVNEWLLTIFTLSVLIMILCNLILALAFYFLLKQINKDLSLLSMVIRLIYTTIFAISMVFLFIEPLLFSYVFLTGQIFFAIHIIVLGCLILKSDYIPKIPGVLFIIGGSMGYIIESLTSFFSPNYVWISAPGIVIAVIAEISLSLWLLLKGNKIPEM